MKLILLAAVTSPFVWVSVPPVCLIVVLYEYAWGAKSSPHCEIGRSGMATVGQTQKKCKDLRKHLVEGVERRGPEVWTLGCKVVEAVKNYLLITHGISTTGEVLAKELRKAQRKGEIRKRINDQRMVEYSAALPSEALFDFEGPKVHGELIGGRT